MTALEYAEYFKGKKVLLKALGCRTNLYEAEAMAADFQRAGADIVDGPPWDVAVLVSCSVTAQADRKCRQAVRRLRRLSPCGFVAAVGCWAQRISQAEALSLGLDLVVGNRRKDRLLGLIYDAAHGQGPAICRTDVLHDGRWEDLRLDRPRFHTRAFIKIQDGCDHFCSYCLIPFLRGKPVTRPLEAVLAEVRSVAEQGCREIVLTGIHLGLYGKGGRENLASVIRQVGGIRGVKRIRLGSLEPFSIGDDLLLAMRDTEQFCRHLHLPLQSGDDAVLEAMKRGYTSRDFLTLLDRIRHVLGDDVHISTDVLAGFPGEDERAFRHTLEILEKGGIGRLHAFPFSPRKGTAAASFPHRPSAAEAEERCREAIALGRSLMDRYAQKWVGRQVSLLVEECRDGSVLGYTSHFVRVKARGAGETSSLCPVCVRSSEGGELKGEVIPWNRP